MTITLYELAGADRDHRFSPHCWKSRLALVHKQLAYESEAVRFTEKEKIAFSNQALVPVITDDEKVINDSWDIAVYLEVNYPDAPSLFTGENGQEDAKAFNQWVDTEIAQYIRPAIIMPIFNAISEVDQEYFRSSREQKLGKTLESVGDIAPEKLQHLSGALASVREKIAATPFIAGEQPDYRDICLLATLLWLACVSDVEFLAQDDTVYAWYQRMLKFYQATIPTAVKQRAA